jgi:hypothetical protein
MATEQSSATARVAIAAGVVGLEVLLAYWLVWLGRPPQMAADDEIYKTVDALFTAVNARNEKQLGECEQQLRVFKGAGRLPVKASDYLDSVINQAREGCWKPAAEQLYDFMKVQRR